ARPLRAALLAAGRRRRRPRPARARGARGLAAGAVLPAPRADARGRRAGRGRPRLAAVDEILRSHGVGLAQDDAASSSVTARCAWSMAQSVYAYASESALAMAIRPQRFRPVTHGGSPPSSQNGSNSELYW